MSHCKLPAGTRLPSPGYSIGFDAGGNVWVGTRKHGLWDMRSGKALGGGGVFCVCTDRSGRVWAGCFGDGLRVCDDGELRDPFGGAGPARRIRWMSVGPAGCVWAATEAGLLTFDPDSLWAVPTAYELYTSRNSGLCGSELNTVFADSRGFVWVGTLGHGVFRCRRLSGGGLEVERYDVGRGLAANEVQAVVEDRDGGIWVATQYGLSRMESGADAFSSFFLSSTLQGDMYSANAAVRAKDGSLLFGTSDGLAVIGPSGMDAERFSPPPCFTEFYAGGRPLVLEEAEADAFKARMESIVAEHLGDAAFTAESWAEQMGLRRTAFYRRTKDVTGMTPNEFLRTARLKRAAELLLEGCLSVSEVAYRVGFDDLSYFSKSFKAYFGMSPSVFQKEKR